MLVKRFFACLLALALLVGMLSGCAAKPSETAAEPMVLFTDSLGRKGGIPAYLPLQRVKVGGHVVLFVANVDHDLRTGGEDGLKIERRLAAVHLAGRGEANEARV